MKIIVVGATGTIGNEIVANLSPDHEVIPVAYRGGDFQVDISSPESIEQLYKNIGSFDALVSAAGQANFRPLNEHTDEDFELALNNKLMGQVNLVRIGSKYINDNGSFTLTSGMLSDQPMPGSASISMANGALESFGKAAALELKNGQRINVVSPAFVKETLVMMGMDSDWGISAADTAKAYRISVESGRNGEVLDVRDFV